MAGAKIVPWRNIARRRKRDGGKTKKRCGGDKDETIVRYYALFRYFGISEE